MTLALLLKVLQQRLKIRAEVIDIAGCEGVETAQRGLKVRLDIALSLVLAGGLPRFKYSFGVFRAAKPDEG